VILDIFHSIGRIDSILPRLTDEEVFRQFFSQVKAAEELGFDTVWVAESHFSSEVQKQHKDAVIPHYSGEVGINCDPMQLAHVVFQNTRKINFGTAIHNIVGGNGGPIASADRVRTLAFLNQFNEHPRRLHIGVAQGRFPFINSPFGILPRNQEERLLWAQYKRLIFVEALEIFLRLLKGEAISSQDISQHFIDQTHFRSSSEWQTICAALDRSPNEPLLYQNRWKFEVMRLVPEWKNGEGEFLNIVLGSHDPMARDIGMRFWPLDIFNLSFTPTEEINRVHQEMQHRMQTSARPWHRSRMPRTVLVFVDDVHRRAEQRASACFDTYIEAMRGTVGFPPKEVLMSRAVVGDPKAAIELMCPGGRLGFEADDRLMLWFEFNQADNNAVLHQMRLFAEKVVPYLN
jgi:hypothetical protein